MTRASGSNLLERWALSSFSLVTLAIVPNFGTDPINIVKFTILFVTASMLFAIYPGVIQDFFVFAKKDIFWTCFAIFIGFGISFFLSKQSKLEQLWGAWGRSTGFLTYFFLLFIFVIGFRVGLSSSTTLVLDRFILLSVPFNLYGLVQILGVDPIPWSRSEVFSTLGNSNFSSAMTGFFGLAILVKLMFASNTFINKLWLSLLFVLDILILIFTRSVQGIVILQISLSILVIYWLYIRGKYKLLVIFATTLFSTALLAIIGFLGRGPFARIVFQETLAYRVDYWRAGLRMIQESPIIGFGFDSYGDYYREYRDFEAVIRTGPERVSNTAHNIFIDIGVNSGLIVCLLVVLLFLISIFRGWALVFHKRNTDSTNVFIFLFILVYFLQCLISINQIGVGVWGWFLLGISHGIIAKIGTREIETVSGLHVEKARSKDARLVSPLKAREQLSEGQIIRVFIACSISLPIAIQPLWTDYRVFQALKIYESQGNKTGEKLPFGGFVTSGHSELILNALVRKQDPQALDYAHEFHELYPRNFYALRVMASLTSDAKTRALLESELAHLDPLNTKS